MFHSTYRGCDIYRKDSPGYALRWTSRAPSGQPLAADTLAGMRQLITETLAAAMGGRR